MKKTLTISFMLSVFLSLVFSVWTVQATTVNAVGEANALDNKVLSPGEILQLIEKYAPGFTKMALTPSTISCVILDGSGNPTTTVTASDTGDLAYWFLYNSGGASSNKVVFIAIPLFQNCPLSAIVQVFTVGGSSTSIVTPFGVPYWGGDATSGRWILIVQNDTDMAYCLFTVVP
jgi:hypothetical protein